MRDLVTHGATRVAAVIAVLVLAACSPNEAATSSTTAVTTPTTTTTSSQTSTTAPSSSTTTDPATTTTAPAVTEWMMDVATETMPEGWDLAFEIPYGEAEELLGTAPGGENLMLGPDYGARAPDGTWWILDGAKKRIAHFDGNGEYLDAVILPKKLLAQGIYFQYQLLRVLADGTLVATRFDAESTDFLRVVDNKPTVATLDGILQTRTDDGTLLYAFDFDNALFEVDPQEPSAAPTDWMRTQTGSRYTITIDGSDVVVELPDLGVTTTVALTSTLGPEPVHPSIEVGTGADGVIHLFMLGISEADETVQLAGYATIRTDGTATAMEPMIDPFTPADPGSPGHLGVAYGSSTPWVMLVTEDGLEVYLRD